MTDTTPEPTVVMRSLLAQVQAAARGRDIETVVTFITRPMWDLWCAALRWPPCDPEAVVPCQWEAVGVTMRPARVCGSPTIIIPGDKLVSFSVNAL